MVYVNKWGDDSRRYGHYELCRVWLNGYGHKLADAFLNLLDARVFFERPVLFLARRFFSPPERLRRVPTRINCDDRDEDDAWRFQHDEFKKKCGLIRLGGQRAEDAVAVWGGQRQERPGIRLQGLRAVRFLRLFSWLAAPGACGSASPRPAPSWPARRAA